MATTPAVIELTKGNFVSSIDGHPFADIPAGEPITIRLAEERTQLATLPETTFFRRYRETFAS